MKTDCKVIKDLLPVYCDEICSEESRNLVDEHLGECESCKKDLELMKTSLGVGEERHIKETDLAKNASTAWKKGKKKAFIKGCVAVALIVCLCFGVYVGYHFFTSVNEYNMRGLINQAEEFFGYDNLVTRQVRNRGNYLAILLMDREDNYSMCVYDRDKLFKNRFKASGGIPILSNGEIATWNFGSPQGEAVLVICGTDLPRDLKQYSFVNDGVTYICPLSRETLDLFVIPDGGYNINTSNLTVE